MLLTYLYMAEVTTLGGFWWIYGLILYSWFYHLPKRTGKWKTTHANSIYKVGRGRREKNQSYCSSLSSLKASNWLTLKTTFLFKRVGWGESTG